MKKIVLIALAIVFTSSVWAATTTEDQKGLLPMGSEAPVFSLADVMTGTQVSPSDFKGKKALMVVFICRHCPYVQHIKTALAQIGKDYQSQDVGIIAISSNDAVKHPADAPESLKEMAQEEGFVFPFVYDESQDVAKAYTAKATPDVFIFDKDQKLVYRGQFDDTRPGSDKVADGKDVRTALDALIDGKSVPTKQKPAVGCSIKWK